MGVGTHLGNIMARDLRSNLPSGWSGYSPADKIDYFNAVGATPQELLASDPTLTQEGLDWMASQGYTGGATGGGTTAGGGTTGGGTTTTASRSAYLPEAASGASHIVTDRLTGQSVQLIPGAPGYDPTNPLAASYLAEISTYGNRGGADVANYLKDLGMYDVGMDIWDERARSLNLPVNTPTTTQTRDLRSNLPPGWESYSPADKINYFNAIGATPEELLANDPTLTQEGLNWMVSQGYAGGTTGGGTTYLPFGNINYIWNSLDPVSTKQDIVQRMLADGYSVQQIRDEISRLATDRSALTEANFNLLGLGLGGTGGTGGTEDTGDTGGTGGTGGTQPPPGAPQLQPGQGSPLTFAPLQRGLAQFSQLRPAAFMPGLLEGSASFGGSGFTPEELRSSYNNMQARGDPDTELAYLMDVGGISPAELASAIGRPMGQLQGLYNFNRPGGLFATTTQAPRGLPEDFVLQTGAYGLTPIAPPRETIDAVVDEVNAPNIVNRQQWVNAFNEAVARGDITGAATIAGSSGYTPQEVAEYVNANLGGLGLTAINPNFQGVTAADVLSLEPTWGGTKDPGIAGDFNLAVATGNYTQAADMARAAGYTPAEIATYVNANVGGLNLPSDFSLTPEGAASFFSARQGGMVKYQEGGEVQPMPKLSAKEAGSKFDIAEFIDDQGRLVQGYNRPIYDENNVLIGYDFQPYQRDVVFNPRLRERESRTLDTEQAMLDMLARQGRTGVSPYVGGLPGIMAREAMMRRQPQYYSTIEAGRRYRGFAKGGLADVAQDLASKGRFGDTMVAHISPQEAGLLKAMGGSGTINPETGLPEFFKVFGIDLFPKKGIKLNLGPLGNIKIGSKSSNLIQAATALAIGDYAGLSAAQSALAYGGVRGAATGNLMEGLQAGLTAYGMGSMYEGLSGTTIGTPSGVAPIDTVPVGSGGVEVGVDPGIVTSQQAPLTAPVATGADAGFNIANAPGAGYEFGPGIEFGPGGEQLVTGMEGVAPAGTGSMRTVAQPVYGTSGIPGLDKTVGATSASQGYLERTLPPGVKEYIPQPILDASGTTLAAGTVLGGSLIAGQQERAAYAAQQAALNREREDKKKRFADLASRLQQQYPFEYAKGGLASLAGGGMTYMEAGGTTGPTGTPRDVTGTGDGMSDSVPASIEGVQEARLADGEFVIPADVVADIGNGSSDAGSKKLYDMMDRIRMARHGTKEQPPEIKAERLMPA